MTINRAATATMVHTLSLTKKVSSERSDGGSALPSNTLSMISFNGHGRSRSATATINVQNIASTKFHFSALRLRLRRLWNLVRTDASVENSFRGREEFWQFLQAAEPDARHRAQCAFFEQRGCDVPAQSFFGNVVTRNEGGDERRAIVGCE